MGLSSRLDFHGIVAAIKRQSRAGVNFGAPDGEAPRLARALLDQGPMSVALPPRYIHKNPQPERGAMRIDSLGKRGGLMGHALRTGLIAVFTLAASGSLAAAELESEAAISAKSVLGAAAAGANYRVQDPVTTDGLLRIYTLETPYGVFTLYGDAMLLQRRRELA